MTIISKEIIERNCSLEIEYTAKCVVDFTNKVNAMIDEIASYKPLYSKRKEIKEKGSEFAMDHMKNVSAWVIKKHLGDNDG